MKLGGNLIPLNFTVRTVQTVYRTVISCWEVWMLWCENPTLLILWRMASGCARVVERVDAAKENGGYLDLSNCQLTKVPDAVFLLMKNVNVHSCNLSSNLISKIPPKLPNNFCLITVLDLSNNKLTSLPRWPIAPCWRLLTCHQTHLWVFLQ